MGREEYHSSWKIVKLVFLREPDAEPKKGIRCCRAIAPASLMSKWYVRVVQLDDWKKRKNIKGRSINCTGAELTASAANMSK